MNWSLDHDGKILNERGEHVADARKEISANQREELRYHTEDESADEYHRGLAEGAERLDDSDA